MRIATGAGLLLLALAAQAETRAPTAAERQAFEQFFRQQAPGATPPALHAERARGARAWTLSAYSDAPPVRAVLPLCRVARTRYTRQDGAWRRSSEQWFWIHHGPQCGTPPERLLHLRAPLAEIDVLRLVQAQADLLQRARLLMAGNTACAPVRARSFQLQSLGRGKDGLYVLGFVNDVGSHVDVSVRQSRAELVAWNVACY